jgi:proline dehydrogenase
MSDRQSVFNFVRRNGLARKFALRFVAGEELSEAVEASRDLNAANITVTLDHLGESVTNRSDADKARDSALAILDQVSANGLEATVSVKLTQMGLDLDPALAADNMRAILERARQSSTFVRIDMEASQYVQGTLDLFGKELHPEFGELVGVVIQSMLRRSGQDVDDLISQNARVRLVKGAYLEPESVAYPDKKDVDASFASLAEALLAKGNYPAIATHDEALIEQAKTYASERSIPAERYEFQMLYGIRRDLQSRLRSDGYGVRVYVPFGTDWYPYLMRRLAERPANIAFIVGSVLKETFSRR